jgi:hypothetical protein
VLREIAHVRQHDPLLRRRWFRDGYFDIFTWQAAGGNITGFQLCYDLPAVERVLSWHASKGYSHERVDDGEASPVKNRTPILVADGAMPMTTVLIEFDARTAGLEPALRAFLRERLLAYAAIEAERAEIDKPEGGG